MLALQTTMLKVVGVLVVMLGPIACGDGAGGPSADGAADGGGRQAFTLVSTSGDGLPVSASVCVEDPPDWTCPQHSSLDCDASGQMPALDPAADAHCAICAAPAPSDPTECSAVREAYNEFVAGFISRSCENFCNPELGWGACSKHVVTNACGTIAIALGPANQLETLLMAEEFAQASCNAACDGVAPGTALSVDAYQWQCIENQCVLIFEDAPGGGPDAPQFPDAPPIDGAIDGAPDGL